MLNKKYLNNYLRVKMDIKSGLIFEMCNSENVETNNNGFFGNSLKYTMNGPKPNIKLIKERIKAGYYDSEEIIEKVVQAILLDIQLKS